MPLAWGNVFTCLGEYFDFFSANGRSSGLPGQRIQPQSPQVRPSCRVFERGLTSAFGRAVNSAFPKDPSMAMCW